MLTGQVTFLFGDQKKDAEQGSLVNIPGGSYYGIVNDSDENAVMKFISYV